MTLDTTPLEAAIEQLERGMKYLHSELADSNPDIKEQFRTAVVQEFEYVYELATKLVDRQLRELATNPQELKDMNFMPRMRLAADAGLVSDAAQWEGYRQLRGRTSHTYDKSQAELVANELDGFLAEARKTLSALKQVNSGEN